MSIVTQLLINDPPDDLSKYCTSPKKSCNFCKKLPMMPWIYWCDAYDKKLEKRYDHYYPIKLVGCEFQSLKVNSGKFIFIYNEV